MDHREHHNATKDPPAGSSVAGILAGLFFVACLLLLLGLVGALLYAGSQRVHAASLESKLEQLKEDNAELQRRFEKAKQDFDQRLKIAYETDLKAPITDTPRTTPTRPQPASTPQKTEPTWHPEGIVFSHVTKTEADPPKAPQIPFPTPKMIGSRTGQIGNKRGIDPTIDRYVLPYQPMSKQAFAGSRDYSPLTFDKDYRHAYFVDGADVLHKLDIQTLVEVAQLDLGAACSEITMSREGLVVGLHNYGRVWVIDPDSLAVRYELPLASVGHVASAPVLGHAYAIGKTEAIAFDVKTGRVVNRITFNPRGVLPGMLGSHFQHRVKSFRIAPDGKHAYTANSQIHQFRVDDIALRYVGSTPNVGSGHTTQMCLSRDGNWFALPHGGGARGIGYGIAMFTRDKLDEPTLLIKTGAYPNEMDWDLTTGKMIAHNHDEIVVFGERGGLERNIKRIRGSDVFQIATLPIGDRFILWSANAIEIWDLQPGRLPEFLKDNTFSYSMPTKRHLAIR